MRMNELELKRSKKKNGNKETLNFVGGSGDGNGWSSLSSIAGSFLLLLFVSNVFLFVCFFVIIVVAAVAFLVSVNVSFLNIVLHENFRPKFLINFLFFIFFPFPLLFRCSIGDSIVYRLVQWTKRLPFYEQLPVHTHTQVSLFLFSLLKKFGS